jgi:Tfp pilus assembly protein PilF
MGFRRIRTTLLTFLVLAYIGNSVVPARAEDVQSDDHLIDEYNTMIRDFRFAEAQELLQKGIQTYPTNPLFPLQLVSLQANIRAYVDLQQKIIESERHSNPGRALRAARRILEVKPDQEGAKEIVATLGGKVSADLKEQLKSARVSLERGDIEKARDSLDALLSIDPSDREVRLLLRDIEASAAILALSRKEDVSGQLARLEAWSVDRKRNTRAPKDEIRKFSTAVAKSLEQNPGDPQLLAQAKRGQDILRTAPATSIDKSSQKDLQEAVNSNAESTDQLFNRGQTLLGQGQFAEAELLFTRLTRLGNLRQISQAYLNQGISRLATISASDVQGARQQRLRAISSFQNALRFDASISLPRGYEKYARDLAEARQTL